MDVQASSTARRRTDSGWRLAATRMRRTLGGTSLDARLTAVAVLFSLGVAVWWLTQDTRVADFYSAIQTRFAFTTHQQIAHGSLTAPFTEFGVHYNYPPLARLIGALGTFIGGL